MKNKLLKQLKEKQGAALIYALCVMAVFTFICFALLFITAQVSTVTTTDRRREMYYEQALSMSNVIEEELADTSSQMRAKIGDYLPRVNNPADFMRLEPRTFVAGATDGNPSMSICLQNGEYAMQENSAWALDAVAYQYVDVTVSVYDSAEAKASVTTRYACYQKLGNMVYKIEFHDAAGQAQEFIDLREPDSDATQFDDGGNPIEIIWNGEKLTLGDAKKWMGAEQRGADGSTLKVTRSRVVNPGEVIDPTKSYYEKIERR
ncbi:MAG: hypothetical protein PUD20_09070 [bacterium]|nr:hypothetical protein [bacterium]